MLTRYPDYYDQFTCLAGSCPDTCCGQWNIVIDPASKARFEAMDGELGSRLRVAMTVVDGEDCFVPVNGRCPMLTEDNLCAIALEHGTESFCVTCDEHPRFTEIYGGLQEVTLALSCPKAADLLLDRIEPLTFLTRSDDALPEPNDLDPDLFRVLVTSRETAIAIAQDRDCTLSDRLALLLCFADRLDRNLHRPMVCSELCKLYCSAAYRRRQLIRIKRLRHFGTMTAARQMLLAMEHLNPRFPSLAQELEKVELEINAIRLEHLTVYYLYRWWLKAACDGCLWQQAAAAVVSVLCIAGLNKTTGDLKEAARLYAKEVEHSEENLFLLRKAMELPQFSRNRLLAILEVPHAI